MSSSGEAVDELLCNMLNYARLMLLLSTWSFFLFQDFKVWMEMAKKMANGQVYNRSKNSENHKKIRSEWSLDAIKTYIMSSDWSSCPLIGHHALLLVIMPSDRSSYPLIDYHVLWLAFMSSDWLSCPMIGHHALLLVIMPSDWSS